MPTLQIGNTSIPYTVRYSSRAKYQRIVVTANAVEVVVPVNTPLDRISAFLNEKQRWLFNAVANRPDPPTAVSQRYINGAKLLYRGCHLRLEIEAANVAEISIACQSHFQIQVPRSLANAEQPTAIATAIEIWMRDRALEAAESIAATYANKLGVMPKAIKLNNRKSAWGTCNKNRVVRINWHLIQAPVAVMEYVVAHEVAHLRHLNHSPEFWQTLATVMPDWKERKALLRAWERNTPSACLL